MESSVLGWFPRLPDKKGLQVTTAFMTRKNGHTNGSGPQSHKEKVGELV